MDNLKKILATFEEEGIAFEMSSRKPRPSYHCADGTLVTLTRPKTPPAEG